MKINTKEVINISFVGKQVCAILTKSAYTPTLIKKLVSRGDTMSRIENHDPLSSENLKNPKGLQKKTPEVSLVNSASYT